MVFGLAWYNRAMQNILLIWAALVLCVVPPVGVAWWILMPRSRR
jgi:hypothetical protein